jgi:hypothetical protein
MIAARQMDFIGKIVRASPDRPAQQMLTACCDNIGPVGRPFLHTKDYIIKNLRLLFANVPEVTIDDFGSLKSWIREAPMKNTGHNLSTASPANMHRFPPLRRLATAKTKPKEP